MNGGHVHEPKLRTSGLPALCKEEKYLRSLIFEEIFSHFLPRKYPQAAWELRYSPCEGEQWHLASCFQVDQLRIGGCTSHLGSCGHSVDSVFLYTLLFEKRAAQNVGVA